MFLVPMDAFGRIFFRLSDATQVEAGFRAGANTNASAV